VEPNPLGLHSDGRLQALPVNIRLGWKCIAVASTQAVYNMAIITATKSFIVKTQDLLIC